MTRALKKRHSRAKAVAAQWHQIWEDCYDYAMPNRSSFYDTTVGQSKMDKIYDETAIISTQEFASRLQLGLTPPFMPWMDLKAGNDSDEGQKEQLNVALADIKDEVFNAIEDSNFIQQMHETFMDLAIGTSVLSVEPGVDGMSLSFLAIPHKEVSIEPGRRDDVGGIYRDRIMQAGLLPVEFPRGRFSESLSKQIEKEPQSDVALVETNTRDYSRRDTEVWLHRCWEAASFGTDDAAPIYKYDYVGPGAFPLIVSRWSKAAGEVWGRGPLVNALPSIKTANLVVELTLENAEMAISGMWQASDDGVLNPDTVNLVPGTIVPVGPTSQGLRPLESPGRFDVANLILEDMRSNIKRALYDEMLGPMDKTPMSATEVVQRVTELQRRIGSPIGRLTLELLVPIIRRVLYLLTASGRIENTPLLDGKQMKATPTSPLSRQQKAEEVNSIVEYLSIVAQTMGPQMVNVIVDSEKAAAKIAELKSIDPDILRSEADRKQITQAMQQQAAEPQQQAQQGPI